MIRKYFYSFALFLATTTQVFAQDPVIGDKPRGSKPNIIIFLVDDLGWQDTSVPFHTSSTHWNKLYRTPNMEKLADEGLKFTHAYATAICSPSRISLMTGMNAARHKVTNWTLEKNQKSDGVSKSLEPSAWNMNGLSPLPDIEKTVYASPLPAILKANGYYTIHAGKAHFAARGTPAADPLTIGFDINIAGHSAGAPESYKGLDNFGNQPGKNIWAVPGLEKYWGKDIFLTEALTLEAIAAIDTAQSSGKPFFLHMAHYAVHVPIMADKRFVQKYYDAGLDSTEARYASLIEGMDKSLGDIMTYLEEKKLDKNTIILFMSDNGGLSNLGRGGIKNMHNMPLRSGKGSVYEGGIRVPFIVKWPDVIQENTTNRSNIIIEDIFPTILSMASASQKGIFQKIDGQDIPLEGNKERNKSRYFFWHYPNVWGPDQRDLRMYSAVRQGDWKLIFFYEDKSFELYNTREDISEQHNLAQAKVGRVKKMAAVLSKHLRQTGASMPVDKKTGAPVSYPDGFLK
jgi:arylsulfatase A-like enzyme